MRMFAKCFYCGQFNLVYERVGQEIFCKRCGNKVDTEIPNLTSTKHRRSLKYTQFHYSCYDDD